MVPCSRSRTTAVGLSLAIVVRGLLGVPIAGSVPLFLGGVGIYLFFATAIGIFLATIARTMPQLGLLYILVAVPLNLLSGTNTPLESMPPLLRAIMQASPSTTLRRLCTGDSLSRRRLRHRMAALPAGGSDRCRVSGVGLAALPQRRGRGELATRATCPRRRAPSCC